MSEIQLVKKEFDENLARVYQPAAHQKGWAECHRLMTEHAGERKYVRVFIGSLTDKSFGAAAPSYVTGLAMHAAMFGYLSKQFEKNMVDSLDKAPTRDRTFKRIFKALVDLFFVHPYEDVANGCAVSIIEILLHTFPELLTADFNLTMIDSFIEPLLKLLPVGNSVQLNSASYCLRKLVQYFIKDQPAIVSYELANRIVSAVIVS